MGPDDNSLVSAAWLDLSKEPVIVHMPDFGSRPLSAQLTDGWTNVFATLSTGTGPRDFVFVGPRWMGELPSGMAVVHSPTDMALILVRTHSSRTVEDIATFHVLQDPMSLTPFSGRLDGAPVVQAAPVLTPMKPPSEQVADMDAKTFFTHFADLLISNPPPDADVIGRLASVGILPGPHFDFDKLPPAVRDALSRSVSPAQVKIRSCAVNEPDPDASYVPRARGAFILAMNVPSGQVNPETSGPTELESEDTISVENRILFKSKGRMSNEPVFDIRQDIERGQAFLKDKTAGYTEIVEQKRVVFFGKKGGKKERLISKRIIRPNFLLAVEDLKERRIRQVLITSRGCVTEGFHVTRTQDNGVASRFEVTYPGDMAILALRTTVRSDNNGLKEVVYTPYSPEIDTRQVRKAGLDYLTGQIELARDDLAAKKVRLAGLRGTGNDMPMELSLVLSIIEHIDPARFEHYKGNEAALVHEVLTIIGANTTTAYSYSKSSAGARGLFQFVPDTYRRLREKYRSARLDKDFVSGCSDHTNAAKASLLLFNSDLVCLPRRWMADARKDGRSIGMYLAAAYNCGPKKVEKSARECKGQWTCLLPEETRIYLKKFDAVWNLRKTLDR